MQEDADLRIDADYLWKYRRKQKRRKQKKESEETYL